MDELGLLLVILGFIVAIAGVALTFLGALRSPRDDAVSYDHAHTTEVLRVAGPAMLLTGVCLVALGGILLRG